MDGFDVINNWWDTELKERNKDKIGEPFYHSRKALSKGHVVYQG